MTLTTSEIAPGGDASPTPEQIAQAFPVLTDDQRARLRAYGAAEVVNVGDTLFRPGDLTYDLVLIEQGVVDIVSPPTDGTPEQLVVQHKAGAFLGELNLLTGQIVYLTARVSEAGTVYRMSPDAFRRLMAEDPELSDLLLKAFLARRELLRFSPAARNIEIVGSSLSAQALALRTYAARQRLPHLWFDSEAVDGTALMSAAGLTLADLPAVLTPGRALRNATPGELAEYLGLSYHRAAWQGSRPGGRRWRSGWSRRRRLRRVRGTGDGADRRDRDGRPGGRELAHRELPRLPIGPQRHRAHRPSVDPGIEVRCRTFESLQSCVARLQ